MFPKLKWMLLAAAILLGLVILWPRFYGGKASPKSGESSVAATPGSALPSDSLVRAKPVNYSSSEPLRPAAFAPAPGAVANAATNNTAGSFIPIAEASRPEELKPGSYEPEPKAKLVDWEILPPDPARPNVLTRARLLDVTGGAASAATSAAEAARISAAQGIKYPFVRVEEELVLNAQGKVASSRMTREMVADEIIVKFPEGTRMTAAAEIAAQLGGVAAEKPFAPMTWLIAVPVSLRAVPSAVEDSKSATPYAEYSEPNLLVRPVATPNDTRYNDLWHLNNTVELNRDIRAESAWDSDTNADGVIVAVIDTGVRYTHEDLAANMWVNPGETASNGIDDDSNGYVDDVYGADEYSNDGNPADGGGHGTMVSGYAGAVGNNGKGVTGVAWTGIKIMALRFIDQTGSTADNVACIDYAINKGAKVINASYGSAGSSLTESSAIQRAANAGIIMVAAAGNGGGDGVGDNNDTTPFYPASYTRSNIIAVGATDRTDAKASFSNFGATSVDLFAPGVNVWSTSYTSDTSYASGSGTSYAAPIVSGALALLRSSYPNDSVSQLVARMLAGVTSVAGLSGQSVTGGRLNLSLIVPTTAPAVLPTAWHRPAYTEGLISTTMRTPAYEVATGSPFTVYSGVRKFNNPGYGTANQTGGTIIYRAGTNGAWSSNALAFHSNNGDYQFWSNSVPGTATTNTVQYYLRLTFDSGVARTNYIYGNDNSSWVTTDEAAAQAQPFSLRDRPSWVYHGNNRSVNGNNVTFTTLVGYAANDASNNLVYQGANFGALYYTTNGATPVGSQGNAGNADTFVVYFTYQGLQQDNSAAGEAMVWTALVTNMPTFQNINYRIGFWNSANGEEQWAGYNTTNTNPVTVFTIGTVGAPQLTISTSSNGSLNADYTTTKLYVDEIAGDSIPVTVTFAPNTSNITAVELFSNLNNRDRAESDANSDGIPDGIVPPDGNTISVTNTNTYYQAYTMTNSGGANYTATINATKTGAYRLSARYKTSASTNWVWYSSGGRRDHAITVAPVQARDIRMYELNIFNMEASGKTFATRSTIEDLTDETNAIHTSSNRVNNFNLGYLQNLGVNWIWFQPYHPYGWEGRHESAANINARDASAGANTKVWNGSSYYDDVNYAYELGSPYAKKNFWEVEPRMSAAFSGSPTVQTNVSSPANRATAMAAFQNFMAKADAAGVNLMPDAAFNHSAWDIELGQAGVDYIMSAVGASGWNASDLIHDREVRVFSRKNDYAQRASSYTSFFVNDIAPAPDRGDFGKWLDVVDIFFGRYSALVSQNPSDNNNRLNEADSFDYSASPGNFDAITRGVWRYFARYAPYWLEKGRPAGEARNSTVSDGDAAARYAFDARGIDGLRCDFGQGLPPQAWEYIINVARSKKWSFVFMSESLDGGAITYRSNRHFDILNENIVFPGKAASATSNYREMFEGRRGAYGQGLVLLNTVSHDEDNYQDPWQAFIRYAVYGTLDGAPMIFPGQELGISNLYGYDLYEINFGKPVPHFKTYNSMMIAWGNDDYALNQLQPAYSAINAARGFSKALRSNNRYFINQTSGGVHESIFSVAKYETLNGSPASNDVVFGFVNLNRDAGQSGTFNVAQDVDSNGTNDYGIKSGRKYNVKNIAAHLGQSAGRRDTFLWGAGLTGGNILSNGIYVGMNAIPGSSSGAWTAAPYEAFYLKLYDTTAPGAVSGSVTNNLANGSYAITNQATFTWAAVAADSEGILPSYKVNVSTNGVLATNAIVTSNSYTYTAPAADTKVEVTVQAVNPNDTSSASAATAVNTSYLLTSGGDYNNNGTNNATDISNGSNPTVNSTPAAVYINEVQSTNTGLPDQHGQLLDWVELYNPGGSSFDLSGYYLSDSLSNKLKYQFPNGTTIAAGGYLLVWCGSATDGPVTSPYNAGQIRTTAFAISSGGEPIVLTAPNSTTIIDQFVSLAIGTSGTPAVGRSLGRGTGVSFDTLYFYTSPTQGAVNNTSGTEAIPLASPVFSVDGGIYTNSQTIAVSTSETNAVIRYTLDGSDPTESSPIYSNALTLTSAGNTNTTNSYIPSNEILSSDYPYYDAWTAPNGSVARINVLRARVFKTGKAPSRITTRSYLIDSQGTNRYAFPVVSIATTPANLFSDATGIYVKGTNTYATNVVPTNYWANYYQSGSGWERSSSIEFYERNGTRLLQGEIGLRLNGNTTRQRPRKALRIYNRSTSGGNTWTNTQLFPGKNVLSWDTFLLRAGGNDWNQALFRDALVSEISSGTGLDRQHSRPVVVFLSGEYWGIHNLRDRIDEPWFFHHYGLTEPNYSLLEVVNGGPDDFLSPGDYSRPIYDHGNTNGLADFLEIYNTAATNGYATAAGYTNLEARIDLDNFIDYHAVTIWAGNTDWPGNNVLIWRSMVTNNANPRNDGKWRYIIKDNDFALGANLPYVPGYDENVSVMARHDTLAFATSPSETAWANNTNGTLMLRKTLDNPIFRTNFINRFADLLNSTLSTNNTLAELQTYADLYGPGITEHSNRWPTPLSWTNDGVGRVRSYLTARTDAVRRHVANKFGLPVADLTVNVNNSAQGTVTVNRLNISSATEGLTNTNAPYPWTGTYFQSNALTVTAAPASGYRFVSWTDTQDVTVGSDSTANYDGAGEPGWTNGSTAGTGLGGWSFSEAGTASDGFFIGSSGRAIHSASADGRSFGIYAHSGGWARAARLFTNNLQTNQTFSFKMSPGGFTAGSSKGVDFGNAATNRFSFYASDASGAPAYYFRNDSTTVRVDDSALFSANTNHTFDVSLTRVAGNVFRLVVSRGGQYFRTNFTATGPVDRADFFNYYSANGDDTNNLFFNNLMLTDPGTVANGGVTTNTNVAPSVTLGQGSRTLTATFESLAASGLAVQLPAVGAAGMPLSGLQVRATNSAGDTDGAFTNSVVLTVARTNGVTLYYTNSAVAGVAAFANVNLPSGATYGFSASSGALVSGAATNLAVGDGALYLPTNNNVWNTATNWDVGAVPNSTTARVIIPANAATNRTITNDTSVTLASLTFSNGSTAFANTIAGPAGNSLTFQAVGTNAVISVTGSGTGNAELNLTGPVVLNSDLVVDVLSTNSANQEYGAMRLRGTNWSGAGGVIKRGPGMAGFTQAGKVISGNILIEQGVLTFSEPSISSLLSTNITVQSGGQLRLSSAFTTTNVPRTNNIKGVLNLAGSGRTGVGTNDNLGVLGALRLETGTTGTTSLLTNMVNLTASADIHVPAGNTIQLSGPLTAASNNVILTKSGGGSLTLGTNAGGFIGGITVNRGALRISAATFTNTTNPIILTNETTLVGSGQWGGALQAGAGSAMTFELGAAPAGTALLRAASATFAGSNVVTVTVPTNAVPGTYPLFSVTGSISSFSNVSLASSVTNFAWSQLILSNNTIFALLATNPPTLPTAWHNPAVTETLLSPPGSMRSPAYDLSGGTNLAIYAAFRRLNNPVYGTAELSAGQLYYRAATNAAWSSAALVFHANSGDHQIWKADLPAGSVSASTEYYIRLAFESGVASPVYIHDNSANNTSAVTVTEATAQAQPFALRKATTTLGDLVQAFNGAARSVTASTAPTSLTVNLTYNGSATAPTNPGLYTVIGTISDATFQGVVTNSFVITGVLPSNDSVIRPTNGKPVQIAFGTLLANDARVASNGSVLTNSGLSIVSVSSAALTNVWLTNGTHVYFRALTNTPEFFTYSVTDGTSTNTATVTVTPTNYVAPLFTLQVVGIGTAVFDGTSTRMTNDFIGVPGQFYAIEYKGEMSDPSWSSAGSTNSGASGSFSVPFIKSGNSAVDWNGSMFFRGYRTNQ